MQKSPLNYRTGSDSDLAVAQHTTESLYKLNYILLSSERDLVVAQIFTTESGSSLSNQLLGWVVPRQPGRYRFLFCG